MVLKIQRLFPAAKLPTYSTEGAAAFDFYATETLQIREGWPATFSTGLKAEVPEGYVLLLFSRSGHGFNKGIRLVNCVGVIDSDYRGEIKIKRTADATGGGLIQEGDRIAQGLLVEIPRVQIEEVEKLSETRRGEGGFGSTGR